jgi:hypothetical protein
MLPTTQHACIPTPPQTHELPPMLCPPHDPQAERLDASSTPGAPPSGPDPRAVADARGSTPLAVALAHSHFAMGEVLSLHTPLADVGGVLGFYGFTVLRFFSNLKPAHAAGRRGWGWWTGCARRVVEVWAW